MFQTMNNGIIGDASDEEKKLIGEKGDQALATKKCDTKDIESRNSSRKRKRKLMPFSQHINNPIEEEALLRSKFVFALDLQNREIGSGHTVSVDVDKEDCGVICDSNEEIQHENAFGINSEGNNLNRSVDIVGTEGWCDRGDAIVADEVHENNEITPYDISKSASSIPNGDADTSDEGDNYYEPFTTDEEIDSDNDELSDKDGILTYDSRLNCDEKLDSDEDKDGILTYDASLDWDTKIDSDEDKYGILTYDARLNTDENISSDEDKDGILTYDAKLNSDDTVASDEDEDGILTYDANLDWDNKIDSDEDKDGILTYDVRLNFAEKIALDSDEDGIYTYDARSNFGDSVDLATDQVCTGVYAQGVGFDSDSEKVSSDMKMGTNCKDVEEKLHRNDLEEIKKTSEKSTNYLSIDHLKTSQVMDNDAAVVVKKISNHSKNAGIDSDQATKVNNKDTLSAPCKQSAKKSKLIKSKVVIKKSVPVKSHTSAKNPIPTRKTKFVKNSVVNKTCPAGPNGASMKPSGFVNRYEKLNHLGLVNNMLKCPAQTSRPPKPANKPKQGARGVSGKTYRPSFHNDYSDVNAVHYPDYSQVYQPNAINQVGCSNSPYFMAPNVPIPAQPFYSGYPVNAAMRMPQQMVMPPRPVYEVQQHAGFVHPFVVPVVPPAANQMSAQFGPPPPPPPPPPPALQHQPPNFDTPRHAFRPRFNNAMDRRPAGAYRHRMPPHHRMPLHRRMPPPPPPPQHMQARMQYEGQNVYQPYFAPPAPISYVRYQ